MGTDPRTDTQLVGAARAGDTDAFAVLVERYQRLVYSTALARLADPSACEDVTQDTFVAAWRTLAELRDAGKVSSWLLGIARNTALSHLRERRRDSVSADVSPPADDSASPANVVSAGQQSEQLWRVVASIPDAYREPLVLFYREEQSVKQVADDLGLTEHAVKQRLVRARRFLREGMERELVAEARRCQPRAGFAAAVIAAIAALPGREAAAAAASASAATTLVKGVGTVKGAVQIAAAIAVLFILVLIARQVLFAEPRAAADRDGDPVVSTPGRADRASVARPQTPPPVAIRGSISGRVIDDNGRPVAGAIVHAREGLASVGATPLSPVATDADGRFGVTGVGSSPLSIAATHPGYLPGRERDARAGAEITLILNPGGLTVSGTVRDVGGGGISGAAVYARSLTDGSPLDTDKESMATFTDDAGSYRLTVAPGTYLVEVKSEDYVPERAMLTLTVPDVREDFVLIPGAIITGQVRSRETGEPVPRAIVTVAEPMTSRAEMAVSQALGGVGQVIRTGADGRFRASGVRSGSVTLGAMSERGQARPVEVLVGVAESRGDVTLWMEPAASVSGTVVVQDTGEPIAGVAVMAMPKANSARAISDDNGQFRLTLGDGSYQLHVAGDDIVANWGGTSLTVRGKDVTGVRVEVKRGAAIHGRLEPVATSATLLLLPALGDDDTLNMTGAFAMLAARGSYAPSGAFAFRGAPRGKARILARTIDGRMGRAEVTIDSARVGPIVIETEAQAAVSGTVVDRGGRAVPGVQVELSPKGKAGLHSLEQFGLALYGRTNTAGQFRVLGLPAGEYELRAKAEWGELDIEGPAELSLEEGRQVELSLKVDVASDVIRGVVVDGVGNPMADVWVEAQQAANASSRRGSPPATRLTALDGTFEIEHARPGDYSLRAVHRATGQFSTGVARAGESVTLVMKAPATLRGTIAGQRPGDEPVTISVLAKGQQLPISASTNGGQFTIERLAAGTYEMVATSGRGTARQQVELGTSEVRDVEIDLEPWAIVRGRAVLPTLVPAADASFNVVRDDLDNLLHMREFLQLIHTRPDTDGRFELKLVAGPATIAIGQGARAGARREVELEPGQVLDLGTVVVLPVL